MRQLYYVRPGKLEWRDAPRPRLEADTDALVRPLAVARCDLDLAILRGEAPFRGRLLHFLRDHLPPAIGQRSLFRNAPFKGPFAFGHECTAVVEDVGPSVTQFEPGQRVIVPFQISCGSCAQCAAGRTSLCLTVPPRSMYGLGELAGSWGGMLSDCARVPFADHMLVPLPSTLDPANVASMADNIVDGWRTVAPLLQREPGASVLVVGGGALSVGLYSAAVAVTCGASSVDYLDRDPERRALASRVGANALAFPDDARSLGPYPIVVDASADAKDLLFAIRSVAPGGTCTSVGIYYNNMVPLPLLEMYGKGVTFTTGRVQARAAIPDALKLCVDGLGERRLAPELLTSRVVPASEAEYALLDPRPKVVVRMSDA